MDLLDFPGNCGVYLCRLWLAFRLNGEVEKRFLLYCCLRCSSTVENRFLRCPTVSTVVLLGWSERLLAHLELLYPVYLLCALHWLGRQLEASKRCACCGNAPPQDILTDLEAKLKDRIGLGFAALELFVQY